MSVINTSTGCDVCPDTEPISGVIPGCNTAFKSCAIDIVIVQNWAENEEQNLIQNSMWMAFLNAPHTILPNEDKNIKYMMDCGRIRVGLVRYGSSSYIRQELTSDWNAIVTAINYMEGTNPAIDDAGLDGYTNLVAAYYGAYEVLGNPVTQTGPAGLCADPMQATKLIFLSAENVHRVDWGAAIPGSTSMPPNPVTGNPGFTISQPDDYQILTDVTGAWPQPTYYMNPMSWYENNVGNVNTEVWNYPNWWQGAFAPDMVTPDMSWASNTNWGQAHEWYQKYMIPMLTGGTIPAYTIGQNQLSVMSIESGIYICTTNDTNARMKAWYEIQYPISTWPNKPPVENYWYNFMIHQPDSPSPGNAKLKGDYYPMRKGVWGDPLWGQFLYSWDPMNGQLYNPPYFFDMIPYSPPHSILISECPCELIDLICPESHPLMMPNPITGEMECCKLVTTPPIPGDDLLIPIDLDDPYYFKDISWTVSYDPKAKAWISFHDWHPELMLPSTTHFMTTKTFECDPEEIDCPRCPDGYTLNIMNGLCEKIETTPIIQIPTIVEIDAIPNGNALVLTPRTHPAWGTKKPCIYKPGYDANGGAAINTAGIPATPPGNPPSNCGVTTKTVYEMTYLTDPWWLTAPVTSTNMVNTLAMWPNGATTSVWYGFTVGLEVQTTETYYLMLAADNRFRFSIRDSGTNAPWVVIMDTPNSNIMNSFNWQHLAGEDLNGATNYNGTSLCGGIGRDEVAFKMLHIYPLDLEQGKCYEIKMEGLDYGGVGMYACAVVQNTEAEIINSTGITDLNFIFRSDQTTTAYEDMDGWICADGSVPLNIPGSCIPVCQVIMNEPGCPPGCDFANPPRHCECIQRTEPSYEVGSIWKHNQRCDLFANYYGTDYPWEIELVETTGQAVNTIRSMEYQLESYVYKGNNLNDYECGDDRWHDLDWNFDESTIYNTEQVSGLLKLNLQPPLDPVQGLQYPIVNLTDIDILYSKVEQKYRFNQFWDITADRGEFTNVEQQIWITELNGYVKELNQINLNYNKPPEQRKKFRHYHNTVLLRRKISENRKMLLKLVNTKLNLSFR